MEFGMEVLQNWVSMWGEEAVFRYIPGVTE
jgi:hypothetical protein